MGKTNTLDQDYFDIVEDRDIVIGRTFVINEAGTEYRGPIKDVRRTSAKHVIITIEWREVGRGPITDRTWRLKDDHDYRYGADLDKMIHQFDDDGTINIQVRHGWVGTILPADTPRLEKPAA